MRCRARIEKEDFPVRHSIRFRNPFRIPTASCLLCFPPFFRCRPPRIARRGMLGDRIQGHQSLLSSPLASGLQIPRVKFLRFDSSSRSIQAPALGYPPTFRALFPPFPGFLSCRGILPRIQIFLYGDGRAGEEGAANEKNGSYHGADEETGRCG